MNIIKSYIRKLKKENLTVLYVWNEYRRFREKMYSKLYSDEKFIIRLFKKNYGFSPNLKNPQRFNEKMNWLKLHYRTDLLTQCADKYSVREYVKQCGLENILNPLYAVYENVDDIDYNELPEPNYNLELYRKIRGEEIRLSPRKVLICSSFSCCKEVELCV